MISVNSGGTRAHRICVVKNSLNMVVVVLAERRWSRVSRAHTRSRAKNKRLLVIIREGGSLSGVGHCPS
jgi:uncharacterized membrane protein